MPVEVLSIVFIALLWVAVPIAVWLDLRKERHDEPTPRDGPGESIELEDERLS